VPLHPLGDALGGDRGVDTGGQVHRLEYRVHGAADRGAVAALGPRWQIHVDRPLGVATNV